MSVSYLVRGGGCGEERRWCGSGGRGVGRSYEKEDNYSGGAADLVMWTHKVVMAAAPRLALPPAERARGSHHRRPAPAQLPHHTDIFAFHQQEQVGCETPNRSLHIGGGAGSAPVVVPGPLRWC